ncbi:hypothetical protein [Erwinia phage Zoomie]|uniref:Uncharacterized protein n=1 Tax=Erwinia phage Zoomie TaxID=2851072 RepID=A0A9E6N8V3_9CAUD|nr:hypothetical protein [Erwinia phage Zoomie]
MAVLKTYTAEHHAQIAASRKHLREATNRIRGDVPVVQTKRTARKPAKAEVKE